MKEYSGDIHADLKSAFFENAYSPFVILDSNLDFVDANQAALTTIGVNKESFVGKNLLDVFPYLKGSNRYLAYKKVLETGIPLGYDERSFKTGNVEHKFMIRAFKIGAYLGISTLDVTNLTDSIAQLKKTQDSLKNVNQNLQRKNQELEDFSYVAAHDLRAPLTNLKSLLQMIDSADPMSDDLKPMIEKMNKVTNVMCGKIGALNKVIELKSDFYNTKDEVVFGDLMDKIKLNYSEDIIDSRTIIKQDFTNCTTIKYNPLQLESILQSLMSNALNYRHPKRKLNVRIKTKVVNGKTILIFKDNGLGFDSKLHLTKVFGLFKRMHTHVEGLGVGLYIINSILNQNGGDITVKSEINKGTEFKIQF